MRKFMLRTAALVLGTLALLYAVLLLMTQAFPEYFKGRATDYSILMYQYRQIAARQQGRNVVIGDSRGNCVLDPTRFSKAWVNLSLPGSFPLEGYVTYERLLQNGNPVDTLLVVYGIQVYMVHYSASQFFEKLTIPYRFIEPRHLEDLQALERQLRSIYQVDTGVSPLRLAYHQLGRRLKYEQAPLAYRSHFMMGFRDMFVHEEKIGRKRDYVLSTLPATRGHMLFGFDSAYSSRMIWDEPDAAFSVSAINRHYLTRLLDLARENGTHVVLLIPPVNRETAKHYKGSRLIRTGLEDLNAIISEYPNVRLEAETFSLDNDCFSDANGHLNAKGVDLYTDILREKVLNTREAHPGTQP